MRKALWLTTAVLALGVGPAMAENWVQVVQTGGMTVSIDRDSITRNGNMVDFTSQTVWDAIQYNSGVPGGKYKWEQNREQIDCANHTYESTSATVYDEANNAVYSEKSEGVQPIRENSVASYKERQTC